MQNFSCTLTSILYQEYHFKLFLARNMDSSNTNDFKLNMDTGVHASFFSLFSIYIKTCNIAI